MLAKQESTWRGPSYGLGVNGGCARLLQPYLPVPGTKFKTLKVSLHSTIAPASPAPRGGLGRGPIFFNTEVTDFTENHPAHFDETDAASRQLMTRNLRTHITSLLNSATLRAPIAPASPAPWGGLGRGSTALASPAPWGGSGRGSLPPLGEGWGGALTRPLGRVGEGLPIAPANNLRHLRNLREKKNREGLHRSSYKTTNSTLKFDNFVGVYHFFFIFAQNKLSS